MLKVGGSTTKNKSDNAKEIKIKVHLTSDHKTLVKKKKLISKLIWCLKCS